MLVEGRGGGEGEGRGEWLDKVGWGKRRKRGEGGRGRGGRETEGLDVLNWFTGKR